MDVGLLVLGIIIAAAGGDVFVRGIVEASGALRIPRSTLAVTLAAFATSVPELAVAVNSGLAAEPDLSLGDAIGSNIVNLSLVLGLVALLRGRQQQETALRRDVAMATLAPIGLALLLAHGGLSRIDATYLIIGFSCWLTMVIRDARDYRRKQYRAGVRGIRGCIFLVSGLTMLFLAGRLIVLGATGLATHLGIDLFIVGALIVAVGTSVPELATAVVSALRGHDGIGIGMILGSNVFNTTVVIPVAVLIHPIAASDDIMLVGLCAASLLPLLAISDRWGVPLRLRGPLLLAFYVGYVAVTLLAS